MPDAGKITGSIAAAARVASLGAVSDLPEVQPFAWLIGTWRGEGVGGYPTLEQDFRYGEQITFDCPGKPLLTFESRTWAVDDGRPLSLSSGFWRPTSPTDVEVVLATALPPDLCRRFATLCHGEYRELDAPGGHLWLLRSPELLAAELAAATRA